MEATPFVSFCFSTYQRPQYLLSTLRSVLLQKFEDYEVIVSDNDIAQSAKVIVEAFNDPRLKYFPNGENLGMKRSYNKSLERSGGRFIVMIADDDPIYPDMLDVLFNLQKNYPGYSMYMGGCDWYCTSPEVGKLYGFKVGTNSCLSNKHDIDLIQTFSAGDFLRNIFSFEIFPHYLWSTCMVSRETLIKIGGVPEYGTPFLGDYAYLAAAGAESGCVVINRSLGCQTLHKENFGRNQNEQILIAAKNFPVYVESKAGHLKEWGEIKPLLLKFVALWVVSHMSFLYSYYKQTGKIEKSFAIAEKFVFKIPYIRKYKIKYQLKKHFPIIHNTIVRLKKSFTH